MPARHQARPFRPMLIGCLLIVAAAWRAGADPPPSRPSAIRPPVGWLAVVHTPSLDRCRSLLLRASETLGAPVATASGLLDTLARRCDAAIVGDGPVAVGLLAPGGGEPAAFAIVTPSSFAELVEEIGAERVGSGAVLDWGELSITLTPFGDHTIAVLSDDEARLGRLRPDAAPLPLEGDLCVSVSKEGVLQLAERAAKAPAAVRSASNRWLRLPWRWPPRLAKLDAVFGMNTPLWQETAKQFSALHLGAGLEPEGAVSCRLRLLRAGAAAPSTLRPVTAVADDDGVGRLKGASAPAYLPAIVGVLTAYQRGRPDELRVRRFHEGAFAAYADRLSSASAGVEAFDAKLLFPRDGDPIETNHAVVVRPRSAPAFIESVAAVADAWNGVVKQSKARDRLLFERRPIYRQGRPGIRLQADLIAAAGPGVKDTPEMRALMSRFVGNNGWWTIDVVELPDGRVLLTDAPLERAADAFPAADPTGEQAGSGGGPGDSVVGSGRWRVDRHVAWLAELARVQDEATPTLGGKALNRMAEAPPVEITLQAGDDQLLVELRAPGTTVGAFGAFLSSD